PIRIPAKTEARTIRNSGTSKPSAGVSGSKGSRLKVTGARFATAIAIARTMTGGRTIQRRSFNGQVPVQKADGNSDDNEDYGGGAQSSLSSSLSSWFMSLSSAISALLSRSRNSLPV